MLYTKEKNGMGEISSIVEFIFSFFNFFIYNREKEKRYINSNKLMMSLFVCYLFFEGSKKDTEDEKIFCFFATLLNLKPSKKKK